MRRSVLAVGFVHSCVNLGHFSKGRKIAGTESIF